jgi:hypothetical protein
MSLSMNGDACIARLNDIGRATLMKRNKKGRRRVCSNHSKQHPDRQFLTIQDERPLTDIPTEK